MEPLEDVLRKAESLRGQLNATKQKKKQVTEKVEYTEEEWYQGQFFPVIKSRIDTYTKTTEVPDDDSRIAAMNGIRELFEASNSIEVRRLIVDCYEHNSSNRVRHAAGKALGLSWLSRTMDIHPVLTVIIGAPVGTAAVFVAMGAVYGIPKLVDWIREYYK